MDKDKTLTAGTSTNDPARTPRPRPPREAEQEAESLSQYSSRPAKRGRRRARGQSRHRTTVPTGDMQLGRPRLTGGRALLHEVGHGPRQGVEPIPERTPQSPSPAVHQTRPGENACAPQATDASRAVRPHPRLLEAPQQQPFRPGFEASAAWGIRRRARREGARQGCGGQQTAMLFPCTS